MTELDIDRVGGVFYKQEKRRGVIKKKKPKSLVVLPASTIPSHAGEIPNLRRIEGQIRGLIRMIEEERYCLDILTQCRSVHAALEGVERKIFSVFLKTCVRTALRSDHNVEPLIEEITSLWNRT